MRSGRLLQFALLRRRPRLYRCPECIAVTDRPDDHAAFHAGRPPNPARTEGERQLDVIVDDTIERCMASPLHGTPIAPLDPERHDHKGYSEERCVRCGWVMGRPPLNCQNDNTPHQFPSQLAALSERPGPGATIES